MHLRVCVRATDLAVVVPVVVPVVVGVFAVVVRFVSEFDLVESNKNSTNVKPLPKIRFSFRPGFFTHIVVNKNYERDSIHSAGFNVRFQEN